MGEGLRSSDLMSSLKCFKNYYVLQQYLEISALVQKFIVLDIVQMVAAQNRFKFPYKAVNAYRQLQMKRSSFTDFCRK